MRALRAIPFAVGVALIGFTALAQLDADGYYLQCKTLYDQQVLDSAQATCQLALAINPQHQPSLKLLSRIALDRNDLGVAQTYLQQLSQLAPTDPEVLYLQARGKLLEGRPREALQLLPPIPSTEVILTKARTLELLGRYEEAYETYRRVTSSQEARLGAARLAEKLGRPTEAIGWLGDTPQEQLTKARLMWLSGQTDEAAKALEGVLPRLSPLESGYSKTLGLLAMVYYGQGENNKGALVLRQLSSRTSLPSTLLNKIWPWLMVFLLYLAFILYGESRIEPMRTVEMTSENRYGPGTLHLWMFLSLVIAGFLTSSMGYVLYQNLLSLFTPVQGAVVRPVFYLLLGCFALLFAVRVANLKGLQQALGPTSTWVEGIWAGLVLLALLGLYSYIAKPLGLSDVSTLYPVFFGIALLEIVIRGFGYPVFQERYRELANFMMPLLFALAIPGPTLYFLVASIFLGWLYRRSTGALPGAVAWIVVGIVFALLSNLPIIRTLGS